MPEAQLVREHCEKLGIPAQLYTPKRLNRRQLPLTATTFVFGDMDCMRAAMQQLRIPAPHAMDYPTSLARFLHRKVWRDDLGGVKAQLAEGAPSLFVKPASRAKRFTGRVFNDVSDFHVVGDTSLREPVWCSTVVAWRSEYRVYVVGDEVVGIDHYGGDASVPLDGQTVADAVAEFRNSGEAPAAYGIDLGVLSSGETALVEANDGFALGAYRIGSEPYGRLLFARWRELLATAER